jgi:cell division protein FtsB
MAQRRTPSGQGPARRAAQSGRTASGRTAAGRPSSRDPVVRGEARGTASTSRSGDAAGAASRPTAARSGDAVRSGNRPAAARRAAAGGAAKRTNAPRPRRLTGRATVLLVVVIALALGYTYPVRVYLSQQSDIARMEAAQVDQRRHIQELTEQVAKWQDDEYVRIQARRRFYYVRPGEIPLVVWDSDTTPGDTPTGPRKEPAEAPPWYDTLWSSIQAADKQPDR